MDVITALLALVTALVIYLWLRRPDPRLPPCPVTPWPIVGHLFTLKSDPRPQYTKWTKEVGDLFSLYMGSRLMVVFNGYDLLKETFVKRPEEFSDRTPMFFDEATGLPGKGVVMSSGPEWKEQRSVTISILRAFGMGKNILAQNIQEEIVHYLDHLASLKGKATDLRISTNLSFANNICSIIIGRRFEYTDETFQDLMAKINNTASDVSSIDVITFFPWLRYIPGDLFNARNTVFCTKQVMDLFVNKFVKEKAYREYDDENIENFIAAYMKDWKKKIAANEPTTMSEEHLVKIIWDLINAGSGTVSTTILYSLLYALHYPHVQEKLYQEIEHEIGTERPPTNLDKQKLTYLNAFIMEVQRICSVAGFALPHTCPADAVVRGYLIPKGTYILPNLDSVSRDAKIWGEDVDILRPERFIDDNGKLKNFDELIPFGLGRRVCPGEAFAKMELFLYLSAMFQRFKFLPEVAGSPPPIEYEVGLDINPVPFKIRVVERRESA